MAVLVFNYFAADYTVMYNYREFYEALGSNMNLALWFAFLVMSLVQANSPIPNTLLIMPIL